MLIKPFQRVGAPKPYSLCSWIAGGLVPKPWCLSLGAYIHLPLACVPRLLVVRCLGQGARAQLPIAPRCSQNGWLLKNIVWDPRAGSVYVYIYHDIFIYIYMLAHLCIHSIMMYLYICVRAQGLSPFPNAMLPWSPELDA